MAEIIIKMLENMGSTYIWMILALIILFISEIKISNDNSKEKVLLSYIIMLVLKFFNLVSVYFIIPFSIIFYFIFIELIFNKEEDRILIYNWLSYILDFIYKLIFKYCYLGFIISLIFVTNKVPSSISSLLGNNELIYYLCAILSIIIYIVTISKVLNNRFKTLSLHEIRNEINNTLSFKGYYHSFKLYQFTKILTFFEDRSFLSREKSFTLLNFEFIKYKYNRVLLNRKNKIYTIKFIGNILKHIVTTISVIFKTVIYFFRILINIIKKLYKMFTKKQKIKTIRSLIRGYSTLEMQLIRTIALKDGYERIYQRKIYEYFYSYIVFKSLYEEFKYYKYKNIDEFKYYLINIYILKAPTFINGPRYSNIFALYKNRDNVLDISNEEFFIYCLGLAGRKLTIDKILNDYYCPVKLNKKILKAVASKVIEDNTIIEPDKTGVRLNLQLKNFRNNKTFSIKVYLKPEKKISNLINYINEKYCIKNTKSVILNQNKLLFDSSLNNILDYLYLNDETKFFNQKIKNINRDIEISILYNVPDGIGSTDINNDYIKLYYDSNDNVLEDIPHIYCEYKNEKIIINLYTCSITNKETFKNPIKTKEVIKFVKNYQNELIELYSINNNNYYIEI